MDIEKLEVHNLFKVRLLVHEYEILGVHKLFIVRLWCVNMRGLKYGSSTR
jgi:hypothetical protein